MLVICRNRCTQNFVFIVNSFWEIPRPWSTMWPLVHFCSRASGFLQVRFRNPSYYMSLICDLCKKAIETVRCFFLTRCRALVPRSILSNASPDFCHEPFCSNRPVSGALLRDRSAPWGCASWFYGPGNRRLRASILGVFQTVSNTLGRFWE